MNRLMSIGASITGAAVWRPMLRRRPDRGDELTVDVRRERQYEAPLVLANRAADRVFDLLGNEIGRDHVLTTGELW